MSPPSEAMKIERFKGYFVPVPPPGKGGKYWLFIKLITDDGIEGTGECTWHGTHRQSALQVAQEIFEEILKGADPMRRERIWWDVFRRHAVLHTGPIATPVLSAIDMACWDIAGKALGEPVYNLLGGLFHDQLRAYTYLYGWKMGDPPEKAAEDILRYMERGFTAVKLDPVGGLEPHRLETLTYVEAVVRAMREAAGDRCDILIGTHGQLTTHAAIRLAKRLEPYEPLWFEEPVAPGNIDEMARVAGATSIPEPPANAYDPLRVPAAAAEAGRLDHPDGPVDHRRHLGDQEDRHHGRDPLRPHRPACVARPFRLRCFLSQFSTSPRMCGAARSPPPRRSTSTCARPTSSSRRASRPSPSSTATS